MASTGFWPVKGRLKDVIEYARNPEKTVLTDDLKKSLGYIADADKTEQMMFVSAINCPKQRAYERMICTGFNWLTLSQEFSLCLKFQH